MISSKKERKNKEENIFVFKIYDNFGWQTNGILNAFFGWFCLSSWFDWSIVVSFFFFIISWFVIDSECTSCDSTDQNIETEVWSKNKE